MVKLRHSLRLLLLAAFSNGMLASNRLPIVFWHGLGDTCCNPLSLGGFAEELEKQLNGTKVFSLKIGSSFMGEMENSFFMNVNDQVDEACKQIRDNPDLQDGYNSIGFSQGGQFLRAIAQRCPTPSMKMLISLGGQHQGVYGLPRCPGASSTLCDYARRLLDYGAYWPWIQDKLVPAEYWHDPTSEEAYREKSIFLADINNERGVNQSYKDNLLKLEKLVLVMFGADSIVQPKESSLFGWYGPAGVNTTVPMNETDLYKQDRIGLKTLDEAGKLYTLVVPDADHLQMPRGWFKKNILDRFF